MGSYTCLKVGAFLLGGMVLVGCEGPQKNRAPVTPSPSFPTGGTVAPGGASAAPGNNLYRNTSTGGAPSWNTNNTNNTGGASNPWGGGGSAVSPASSPTPGPGSTGSSGFGAAPGGLSNVNTSAPYGSGPGSNLGGSTGSSGFGASPGGVPPSSGSGGPAFPGGNSGFAQPAPLTPLRP